MAKRKRRTFTAEFKTEVVLEVLTGESSQAELCRRHNLSEDQVSKWMYCPPKFGPLPRETVQRGN